MDWIGSQVRMSLLFVRTKGLPSIRLAEEGISAIALVVEQADLWTAPPKGGTIVFVCGGVVRQSCDRLDNRPILCHAQPSSGASMKLVLECGRSE